MVCSAIRLELKRFSREHRLSQGLLVTYSPLTMTGDNIRAEMCVGKREVEELKQRMADLALDQMLPVNLENHLVILKDCVPTQSGHGRLQTENNKKHFMGALCIDRAVMRRKSTTEGHTEVGGEHVLTFPMKL